LFLALVIPGAETGALCEALVWQIDLFEFVPITAMDDPEICSRHLARPVVNHSSTLVSGWCVSKIVSVSFIGSEALVSK
jgi:hypothetical protein